MTTADERPDAPQPCDAALRRLLDALRRARLAEVRAIEEYLGIAPERPQRSREARVWRNEGEEPYRVA